MPNIDKEVQKQAIKEAFREFLDDKLAKFGWFSMKWICSAFIVGVCYVFCKAKGIL